MKEWEIVKKKLSQKRMSTEDQCKFYGAYQIIDKLIEKDELNEPRKKNVFAE